MQDPAVDHRKLLNLSFLANARVVDNGERCDLRVSFVLSVLRLFSRTFDGVIDKNTLSRVARIYSTCQNDSQTQHERQTPIRNQH